MIKGKLGLPEADPWAMGWTIRGLVLIACVMVFAVPLDIVPIVAITSHDASEIPSPNPAVQIPLVAYAATPTPTILTPTPHVPHIGIIAGHTGNDSGAICPDGLQEVTINTDIARRTSALLVKHGWIVDLLEEFDPRLNGYRADALISIHADSCSFPGKSGFKVARAESSYLPTSEDRLVACLSDYYEKRSGLQFDPYTITYDMTRYHAYYEIDRNTPAAIIEVGFMLDDREILTQSPHLVAQGIFEGLVCFLEKDAL